MRVSVIDVMPMRARSRSFSRGRASKRYRSRSASARPVLAVARRRYLTSRTRRSMISPSLNVHHFSRWTEPTTRDYQAPNQALDFEFKFSDIIASSEFGGLYDQFKIDYVVVLFQLITNPDAITHTNMQANAVFNATNWFPKLWYIRDYDGGSSETLSTIKERQGVKCFVLRPNKTYSVKLRPMVAVQTYATSTTTGYGPKRMFLDFANGTSVPHYGLKTVFDPLGIDPSDTYPFRMRYETKYYFTCKNVR